jgi:hypothetical protein
MEGTMVHLADGTRIHAFRSPFYGWIAVHYVKGLEGEEIARRGNRRDLLESVGRYIDDNGYEMA